MYIIYCATHSSCKYLYNKLQESLTNISIDYFHGGLCDNERETAMNNWKTNNTQIMVATSAFGMGINSNNVRVVIHVEAPMSISMSMYTNLFFFIFIYSNIFFAFYS